MNSTISPYHHHPYASYRFENTPRYYAQSAPPLEDTFDDEDQIPSVEEFRAIIDDYLNNLSPKKRDKALVDQHRYLLIQQVLRDPRNTAISTAQFRFWVKKMFQLQPGTADLVCHDNKPVAMKEQIYDILVKAHREAHHGGRDKTSALVRRRFSWIPKELVARFVRHCPFCITRRNSGHSSSTLISKSSSPRNRYSRNGCSFDSSNPPLSMYTPSSLKEESDLSSGPPSSDSGYEPTPNYVTVSSSSSSPKRPYFNSMYDNREEPDFTTPLDCHYDGSLNSSLSLNGFRSTSNNNIHPLTHHQHSHPQPHSPLFYHQSYSGYPFYSTSYYSNGLGITPCQDNDNASKASSAAAVAIHAASSTTASAAASCAVAAAAAAALLPSPTGNSDVLTHNQDSQYSRSSSIPSSSAESNAFVSYPPIMPENTFVTEL